MDTLLTGNINFVVELLQEYFEQTKNKVTFKENDLILIELYLAYLDIEGMHGMYSDEKFYESLLDKLLKQFDTFDLESLFIVNKIVIGMSSLSIKNNNFDNLKKIIAFSQNIMQKTQDFNRMPILNLIEWKYALNQEQDFSKAKAFYEKSRLFAQLTGDSYLEEQLIKEWQKDNI